jgi:phosphoglycolate phosphatase-like HAD superfamily hydrolase
VLFDVDGVLVDIRRSYNAAIKKTVEYCYATLARRQWHNLVTDSLILKFRQTAGFNNDTDTSYAILLALLANPLKTSSDARKFLETVARNADSTGIASVEKYLSMMGFEISKHKDRLSYPAPVKDSFVGRVFDEFFYGPDLFKKQNGIETKYWISGSRPLIANDRVVVTSKTLSLLCKKLRGNLAMVTGRSRVAAEYSLKSHMKHFDLRACVFLEDESREYAKPSPYAVNRAMHAMNSQSAIYAGDSMEDLLMAKRAQTGGLKITFVGVYGMSPDPLETKKLFSNQVGTVAKTVNSLPTLMNRL